MTLREAKKELKAVGVRIEHVACFNEYRVAYTGPANIRRFGFDKSPEDTAYYTNDLADAVETGRAMGRELIVHIEQQAVRS